MYMQVTLLKAYMCNPDFRQIGGSQSLAIQIIPIRIVRKLPNLDRNLELLYIDYDKHLRCNTSRYEKVDGE